MDLTNVRTAGIIGAGEKGRRLLAECLALLSNEQIATLYLTARVPESRQFRAIRRVPDMVDSALLQLLQTERR